MASGGTNAAAWRSGAAGCPSFELSKREQLLQDVTPQLTAFVSSNV